MILQKNQIELLKWLMVILLVSEIYLFKVNHDCSNLKPYVPEGIALGYQYGGEGILITYNKQKFWHL